METIKNQMTTREIYKIAMQIWKELWYAHFV